MLCSNIKLTWVLFKCRYPILQYSGFHCIWFKCKVKFLSAVVKKFVQCTWQLNIKVVQCTWQLNIKIVQCTWQLNIKVLQCTWQLKYKRNSIKRKQFTPLCLFLFPLKWWKTWLKQEDGNYNYLHKVLKQLIVLSSLNKQVVIKRKF